MKQVLLIAMLFVASQLMAQYQQASLNADGTIHVKNVPNPPQQIESRGGTFEQLPGFPKGVLASPTFKNFRNVTLADVNGDGVQDILVGTHNTLYAYSSDSLLWQKTLSGTAIYPPSVADVDGDGDPEIVLNTGGVPAAGRIYLLDHEGNDLPGWPVNFSNHWMLSAPTVVDLDGDGELEILSCERIGTTANLQVLKLDGTPFNENFPITVPGTLAVTPSVGDVDNDGENEIVVYSTTVQYVFKLDGSTLEGWPIENPATRFSYQSPVLADLDGDGFLEIIGATHGDAPEYYIRNYDGTYKDGWPQAVPGNNWTYSPPTVIQKDGEYVILMSRPIGETPEDMLYGWDAAGNLLDGFPIIKSGGLEGPIIVADLDGDGEPELLFDSNLFDGTTQQGFLHAYKMDGSGELDGFPIRPHGWTYLNGATPGDVNGDGLLDITVLTYTQNFGAGTDSTFINVYNMNVEYKPETILWGTYKGSNQRTGALVDTISTSLFTIHPAIEMQLFPNPAQSEVQLSFKLPTASAVTVEVVDISGRILQSVKTAGLSTTAATIQLSVEHLQSGLYFVRLRDERQLVGIRKLIIH